MVLHHCAPLALMNLHLSRSAFLHRLILLLHNKMAENEWAELRACVLIAIGAAFVGAHETLAIITVLATRETKERCSFAFLR
jgi:hypothetical protein